MKLSRFIGFKLFFLSGLIFFAAGISALLFVLGTVEDEIVRRQQINQNLFAQEIANDVLTGMTALAYRKCKLLLSDLDVVAVTLKLENGTTVCNVSEDQPYTHKLVSPIFFDSSQTNKAAIVEIMYSSSLMASAKAKLGVIATLAILLFF
ncbi:hypothetical protein OAQ84_01550, partial [Bdellovibrionales bacterium]|nr:hypothetical protein [Bdellovibrionales bacterium]